MSANPAHVTADRLDRAQVGQFIHTAPIVLTDATPKTNWLQIDSLDRDAISVLVGFADGTVFIDRADRLVRLGWS